jgi:excisionase family DNA binding protein
VARQQLREKVKAVRASRPVKLPTMELVSASAYLKPAEVAAVLRVDARTVKRWAQDGKLPAFRTPGGHWRIAADALRSLRDGQ